MMYRSHGFRRHRSTPRFRPSRSTVRRLALTGVICAATISTVALDSGGPAASTPGADPAAARPGEGMGQTPSATGEPDAAEAAGERRPPRGKGTNLLLTGIDRRTGISPEVRDRLHVNGEECDCTDVMMLLHISEDGSRASVVSIPRDSYVRFAAHRESAEVAKEGLGGRAGEVTRHRGKINSAFAHGDRDLTVRTVEQATGVRVDHYLQADFASFAAAVDRLEGATVCTDKPLWDRNSGLDLNAGRHRLDGPGALRFARARHVFPPGDLGRVRRQQQLVAGILERLASPELTGDPAKLLRTVYTLRGTVRVDDSLSTERLVELGRDLRGLEKGRTEFATVPIDDFDHRVPGWGSSLTWDKPRATALFEALREDRSLLSERRIQPPPGVRPVGTRPSEVSVRVEGRPSAAAKVASGLRRNGFLVADGGGRATAKGRTEIRYAPHWKAHAAALAEALPGARQRPVAGHSRTLTVRLARGEAPSAHRVATVAYDRSSVEGAPVSAGAFDCDQRQGDGRAAAGG